MTQVKVKSVPANIGISVEFDEDQIRRQLAAKAESAINYQIGKFFSVTEEWTQSGGRKVIGEGLRSIDEKVLNEWVSDAFQTKMQKYFDDNFERVMNEAMKTALQHKANKYVFSRNESKTSPTE